VIAEGLQAFVRCSVAGCEWHIQLKTWMATTRCYQHLGPAVPQYRAAIEDGAILEAKFMPREADPEFDPAA
jgi:hypothetical protein